MGVFLEEANWNINREEKIIDPAAERENERERENLKTPTYGKFFGISSMFFLTFLCLFFQENFWNSFNVIYRWARMERGLFGGALIDFRRNFWAI
jgi:hypothetical protein